MRGIRMAATTILLTACLAGTPFETRGQTEQALDVNDLAFLWPVPQTEEDVSQLISADQATSAGHLIWPSSVFKTLLDSAQAIRVEGSATVEQIQFDPPEEFAKPSTWKLAGFRVDPSAPGGHDELVKRFGSTPQLRVVFQPVTKVGSQIKVHDVAAHLAFSYARPPAQGAPAFPVVPNKDVFGQVIAQLKALRDVSSKGGAPTAGPLRVHPGLRARVPGLAGKVKAFLDEQTSRGELNEVAFMGISPPEPWIFFSMRKNLKTGGFDLIAPPSLGGKNAQMLFILDPAKVLPRPATTNMQGQGVSTAPLFSPSANTELSRPVFSAAARPTNGDIPDIIANPRLSNVLNTDCVSCHSESTRRAKLGIGAGDGKFRYNRPDGISGVDPAHVPADPWNVRNFGWFQSVFGGPAVPTISQRTANEAAEAAAFANREYLSIGAPSPQASNGERSHQPMPEPVASPLTLVMDIKSPEDFLQLKTMIERMQSLPPEQNPIVQALNKLKTVHFARFVFLNERQLAVITTYDGSFEAYIDAFATTIGPIFDQILAHVADAPPLPVQKPENRKPFLEFVRKHDLKGMPPFYSAYPNLGVLDILTLQKKAGGN